MSLAALSAWEGLQQRQTPAAHWSVGLTIAGAALLTVVLGRGRQLETSTTWLSDAARGVAGWRRTPRFAAGVAVWTVLIAAVIGWDLNSFAHQAHDLPTLSSLFGKVTGHQWGRAGVFACWLAAGVGIAAACRAPRRGRR